MVCSTAVPAEITFETRRRPRRKTVDRINGTRRSNTIPVRRSSKAKAFREQPSRVISVQTFWPGSTVVCTYRRDATAAVVIIIVLPSPIQVPDTIVARRLTCVPSVKGLIGFYLYLRVPFKHTHTHAKTIKNPNSMTRGVRGNRHYMSIPVKYYTYVPGVDLDVWWPPGRNALWGGPLYINKEIYFFTH